MLSQIEKERYAQHIKLSEISYEGQLKLKRARILCVGAGGLASPLLLYLAAAGVGTLAIVDQDQVELSNLQRQILYQTKAVGKYKVSEAQKRLEEINPEIEVLIYPQRFEFSNASGLIKDFDLVADCSDNFATRYLINDICCQLNKPLASASVEAFKGQCAFFTPSKGACYRCVFPRPPAPELIPNCAERGILGVLPGIMGLLQATEILKWILAIGTSLEGRLLSFDALAMSFQEFKFEKNIDCPSCALHKTAKELMLTSASQTTPSISMAAFKERELLKDFLLVDVRNEDEHLECNMGGVLIPLPVLKERLNELNPAQEIIVYCRSGRRSQTAVQILIEAGFANVKYLEGGILAY